MCSVLAVAPVPTTVSVWLKGTLNVGDVGLGPVLLQAPRARPPASHRVIPNILKLLPTLIGLQNRCGGLRPRAPPQRAHWRGPHDPRAVRAARSHGSLAQTPGQEGSSAYRNPCSRTT